MIFIRKSSATSNNVLDDDIQYSLNWDDPMPIFAITATNFTSAALAKCGDKGDNGSWTDKNNNYFTAEQMLRWYKQQLYTYTPENTEEAMDQLVSELVEAKVEVAYMHGRGDHDKVHNVDDRLYTGGPGAFGPRLIKRFVDAVKRSPYAKDHLKMAYFVDNAVFPRAYDDPKYGNTTGNGVILIFRNIFGTICLNLGMRSFRKICYIYVLLPELFLFSCGRLIFRNTTTIKRIIKY